MPDTWELVGHKSDGTFLEGLSVATPAFETWLNNYRHSNPVLAIAELVQPSRQITDIRPTIAVLPLQSKPGSDYESLIGDMLSEEATRALSRSTLMNVISHLSCRNVDTTVITLGDLQQSIGVDYVLSGRVRVRNDAYHLSVDFTDVESGTLRWSQDLTGQVSKFVDGNDEVAYLLARAIGREVVSASIETTNARQLYDVESHYLLVSAIALMHRQALGSFSQARPRLEELISRAPRCAALHAWLAMWYVLSVGQGWSVDFARDAATAADSGRRALDIDPECAFSLAVDGFVQNNLVKRFDVAAARFDEAIELDPNNALAWLLKGTMHAFVDQGSEAVSCTDRAQRLSPVDPYKYLYDSLAATARLSLRDFTGALELANRSFKANRRHISTLRVRTIALQSLGRTEEALTSAVELVRLQPSLTVEGYLKDHPAALFATGREWAEALRKSGVPTN
ncbi:hypothetical protein [Pelagibius sp. Alg239-R121]|uniref:tetratricopeptide repeat protein n=1 Tax=Pelagibius sp. Alg239-R121 TaxID=2993448 RepID=UPI0024A798E1|nr:hypothetical protein [Pelagibius sp. Alg239-R121]